MRTTTAIESNISSKRSWYKFHYYRYASSETLHDISSELQDLFDELDRAKGGFELIKEPK